jgi:Copine
MPSTIRGRGARRRSAPAPPKRRLSLYLEAQNLVRPEKRAWESSALDPSVIVEVRDADDPSIYTRLGRTEALMNNNNPRWCIRIILECPATDADKQLVRFRVLCLDPCAPYDHDLPDNPFLDRGLFVGQAMSNTADVAEQKRLVFPLYASSAAINQQQQQQQQNNPRKPARSFGTIAVHAENLVEDFGDTVQLQFACSKAKVRRAFYVLSHKFPGASFAPVHYSEIAGCTTVKHESAKFRFRPYATSLRTLCNSDPTRPLQFSLYSFARNGKHVLAAQCSFTFGSLLRDTANASASSDAPATGGVVTYNLVSPVDAAPTDQVGTLYVVQCSYKPTYTFSDYLKSADICLNTMFAVDMSATRGVSSNPLSYGNTRSPSDYEAALCAVGQILCEYDSMQTCSAWGFGAGLASNFPEPSQFFSLTGTPEATCAPGPGVAEAYCKIQPQVTPQAPCQLNPVLESMIQRVAEEDRQSEHGVYFILALFTDGNICDHDRVADTFRLAASLPMSVIVIGEDDADKPLLDVFEEQPTKLTGACPTRKVAHFIPFRKYRENVAPLAELIRSYISDEFCTFFRRHGIRPGDKRDAGLSASGSAANFSSTGGGSSISGGILERNLSLASCEIKDWASSVETSHGTAGNLNADGSDSRLTSFSGATCLSGSISRMSMISSPFPQPLSDKWRSSGRSTPGQAQPSPPHSSRQDLASLPSMRLPGTVADWNPVVPANLLRPSQSAFGSNATSSSLSSAMTDMTLSPATSSAHGLFGEDHFSGQSNGRDSITSNISRGRDCTTRRGEHVDGEDGVRERNCNSTGNCGRTVES